MSLHCIAATNEGRKEEERRKKESKEGRKKKKKQLCGGSFCLCGGSSSEAGKEGKKGEPSPPLKHPAIEGAFSFGKERERPNRTRGLVSGGLGPSFPSAGERTAPKRKRGEE